MEYPHISPTKNSTLVEGHRSRVGEAESDCGPRPSSNASDQKVIEVNEDADGSPIENKHNRRHRLLGNNNRWKDEDETDAGEQ